MQSAIINNMSKRFIALAFATICSLVTLELHHKKNGGADDNNLRRVLTSPHVFDPKTVGLRDQAPLGHSNTLVVQGQLYTPQGVVDSIDRINNCPAHPVRCRNGLMELAVQLKSIDSDAVGHVAEVGVFQGAFSKQQASTWLPNAKTNAIYHAIDAWQFRPDDTGISAKDKNFADDKKNLKNMRLTENNLLSVPGMRQDSFKLIREFSIPAADMFPDEYFDYIYIDALHTYDAAYGDMAAWWPKLKRGGLFAGDDFGDPDMKDGKVALTNEWGVRSASRMFAKELQLPLYTTISPQSHNQVRGASYLLMDDSPCYIFPAWYFVKP